MQISLQSININNFNNIAGEILQSEQIYPKEIRSSRTDYLNMIDDDSTIAIVAYSNSEYIGNLIASELEGNDLEEMKTYLSNKEKVLYIYNILVNPEHQGKGYGYKLLAEAIEMAKKQGYKSVTGHFRPNGSLRLILKFGAEIKKRCSNWEDSGEEYCLCELSLTH